MKRLLVCGLCLVHIKCAPPPAELAETLVGGAEAGEMVPDATSSAPEDMGTSIDASVWPRMGGVWRVDQNTVLRAELPVLGQEVETLIQVVLLVEIRQSADELWLYQKTCDVRMENTPALNQTLLPDAFISSLPRLDRRAQLTLSPSGDFKLTAPRFYEQRGVTLAAPESDSLPTDSLDPRVFDQDEDGKPGLTAQLIGFPEGDVNLIQVSWDEWSGTLLFNQDDLQVTSVIGTLKWDQRQMIIEASNPVLKIDVPRWIPEDTDLHRFEMRPVESFQCPPRRESPRPEQ